MILPLITLAWPERPLWPNSRKHRQVKEVFAELKGRGFDVKAVREILKQRRQDPNDLAEQEAIIDLYRSALGMA